MPTVAIVLAIAMPLIACAVNSWLNLTIKFASDANQAKHEVKLILLRIFNWISNAYQLGVLIWEFTFPLPLTRLSFVGVLLPILVLFHSYFLWWLGQILEIVKKQNELMQEFAPDTKKLIDLFPKPPEA